MEVEMDFDVIVRGVAIGFSVAAPVGPIGLLVIRRAIADGRAAGLATGLGAAAADALYGAVAGLGLSAVVAALSGASVWLRLGGGLFLIVLGIRAARSRPPEGGAETAPAATRAGLARAFGSTLLLTLANPMTVVSFAAVMASVGVGASGGGEVAAFVAAVFAGSALWWLLLSGGASLLRSRITPRRMRWINVASGLVLAAFGLAAIVSVR
jgi:threonine/homoserine/homoserine lactone efflux protein